MSKDKKINAILNAEPKRPKTHELGGGIYYTCFWISCGEDLKRWYNYCPKCGQKIDWSEEE